MRTQRADGFGRADLLELLPRDSVGAEVGVWKGDFAAQILGIVRPRRLHLIDPWKFLDEKLYEKAWAGGGAEARNQADMDGIYQNVRNRFSREIQNGIVVLHRSPSAEIGRQFEDSYFDWVYIDGNHLYEFVRLDLTIFAAKVRSGGLITGDDYAEGGWWKGGVKRAVDEFVAAGKGEPIHLGGRQFVLRRR